MPRSLLDLPPELLTRIFEHVEDDDAGKRPICRALLPLTRANLFRRVRIRSPARLHDFVRTFPPPSKLIGKPETRSLTPLNSPQKRGGTLGRLVKHLDLPDVDFDEHEETNNCRALRKVLTMAKGTETLRLEGTGALRVMLTSFRSYRSLQHLHTLELADFDAVHILLYDLTHFGRLLLFPKLTCLVMDVHYEADETDSAVVKRVQPVPNIAHLVLTAGMSLSDASASNFISHFTRLTHFDLILTDLCELSLLLQAVSPTLISLSIEFGDYIDWLEDDPGIIDLELDTADLLRYLRNCQPVLRHFTLYGFYAYARYIPSEHPDDPAVASGTYSIERKWSLHEWTPSFTFVDAKEVVRFADSMGVGLEGGLRRAVKVEELRQREEKYLEDRRDEVAYDIAWLFELEDSESQDWD
ncbi:hypothetical protein JCM10207_004435 [Rhodosporidiobolus poonsookiae]